MKQHLAVWPLHPDVHTPGWIALGTNGAGIPPGSIHDVSETGTVRFLGGHDLGVPRLRYQLSIAVARTEAERANHVTSSDPASLLPDVMSELRRSREQYIGVRSCGRPAHEVADRLGVSRQVGEEVLAAHPGERECAPEWVHFAGCVVDSAENRRCFACGHGWTSE